MKKNRKRVTVICCMVAKTKSFFLKKLKIIEVAIINTIKNVLCKGELSGKNIK